MSRLQSSVQPGGTLRPFRKIALKIAAHWPFPVPCRLRSGRTMYVDLRSAIGRGIFMRGEFDPGVFRPFETILRPGNTFLDVGANLGYYSMRALDRIGETGTVYAFEIDERPLRCLRKTIARQGLLNLYLYETAVGDAVGSSYLIRSNESGNSRVGDYSTGGIQVPMTTLDEWYSRSGRPKVDGIKIDIEGSELRALQGACRLIAEQRPLIICEAWDAADPSRSQVGRFLKDLSYEVEALKGVDSPVVMAQRIETV